MRKFILIKFMFFSSIAIKCETINGLDVVCYDASIFHNNNKFTTSYNVTDLYYGSGNASPQITWSTTIGKITHQHIYSNDVTLEFSSCGSGVLTCVVQYFDNNYKNYATKTITKNISAKLNIASLKIKSGPTQVICGDKSPLTYSFGADYLGSWKDCYEIGYQSIGIWDVPQGWDITNATFSSMTVVPNESSNGEVSFQLDIEPTKNCYTNSNSITSKINVNRIIPNDFTTTNLNTNTIVGNNSIIIQNASSNSQITTKVKAGNFVSIKPNTQIKNLVNNFTQIVIGIVSGCNANKISVDSKSRDTIKSIPELKAAININDFQVNLYPNPAKENLYLKLSNLSSKKISIKIFDLMGRFVIEESVNDIIETNLDLPININNLNSGNYILNLKTDNEQKQLRFVKE